MSKTFDLSTLNLSAGTHKITVKARASGYLDSPASNAVNYVVAEETTYKLSGTWVFNEKISVNSVFREDYIYVNFTSNSEPFDGIYFETKNLHYGGNGSWMEAHVYNGSGGVWLNEAYRTITFDGEQTVSQEFYDWFTANAVKRPNVTNGLAYTLSSDGTYYTCTGIGTATNTDVVIASEINGIPVTEIGYAAFKECTSLTSIVIPDSVTSIVNSAFYNCTSLTSVEIGDSVTSIGSYAFIHCSKLTSVTIPDSVTSIGTSAFQDCESLMSVNIPDGVIKIETSLFQGCSSLTKIVIPDSAEYIYSSVFLDCESLMSVNIPDGVEIWGDVFFNCSSLTKIVIPRNVTIIGSRVFLNCNNLTIYCEAESQPSDWDSKWNKSNCPVVWGYTGE